MPKRRGGRRKRKDVYVLEGWRLKLFNNMMKKGFIKVKDNGLIVTDKFMKIVNKRIKKYGLKSRR
jgi:hypothetical protein